MNRDISAETLHNLQNGDAKAFEEVFVFYFKKIKIFIAAYVKSDSEAEELAEDLFVNLWINRKAIQPNKSFNSYMHTIARNEALNHLRHKKVVQSYESQVSLNDYSDCSDEELIARETALLIDMAIDRMPEQRKKIFKLSRQQGLKNEEIAILLNTTKRNVESQLSLALKEIRQAISILILFLS